MTRASGNLFGASASHHPCERIDALIEQQGVTVERIVSCGHASPPGFWYDSPRAEWVGLLSGAAALEFAGQAALHEMRPGDWVWIEAHCRHRVARTHESEPTVWLAVYFPAVDNAPALHR